MTETSNNEQSYDINKILKDFEYTLNLLVLVEDEISNEELKTTISNWLDIYRTQQE